MYMTRLKQHVKIRCVFSNNSLFFIRQKSNDRRERNADKVKKREKKISEPCSVKRSVSTYGTQYILGRTFVPLKFCQSAEPIKAQNGRLSPIPIKTGVDFLHFYTNMVSSASAALIQKGRLYW